ncbi:MAG: dioxygenase [Ilumatobacteraceae bacterium]
MSAPDELLEEVLGRYAGAPNPRLKEVMESAIRHLHSFVREINPSKGEWFEAIKFLTATGQICSETRQEWILMSDTLGVSTLLEMLNYAASDGTTENTVLGPFYVAGSPERKNGETMLVDPDDGERVVVRGRVTDIDGKALSGVVLDCWQNATAGFYACQQPGIQSADNLRGIYRTDADGRFEIRSVRPVPYPIPYDGPVGALLKANARNWMRPGHMHVWLSHPGFKDLITHVFDTESDYLHDDAVFGVRDSLVCTFAPDTSGELATTFDFVLDRA